MAAAVTSVAAALLFTAASSAPASPAILWRLGPEGGQAPGPSGYPVAGVSVNDQATILTAQGLLNRDKATLFLDVPFFWTYPPSSNWFVENYLGPQKNYAFTNMSTSSFCDVVTATKLLGSLGGPVRGLALYNESALDATRWIAVTTSALEGLLPFSVNQRSFSNFSCIESLPILADFSEPFAAHGWTSNVEAYQWAQANLLPQCNATNLYSAGQSFNDSTGYVYNGHDSSILIGLDGAVALKMLVFNLSPDPKGYPAHAAQFTALVAALRASDPALVPNVVGWAEPEPAMTQSVSLGGGSVLCDAAPNFSFWLKVAATAFPTLPYHADASITLQRDRVYMSWQSNEGDTPKILAALQGGAWVDPRRGSIPIAWGFDPLVTTLAPGLVEFYASTATRNDSFFAATAGAGYAYPWIMPPISFQSYTQRAAQLLDAMTPTWPPYSNWVDIWDSNNPSNISAYYAHTGATIGAFSMQPESMSGSNTFIPQPDGTVLPLIITNHSLWYAQQWNCTRRDDPVSYYTDAIEWTVRSGIATRPVFLLAYGIVPSDACGLNIFDYALAVQERLASGSADGVVPPLQVVGAQDMARLAREAGARGWGVPPGEDEDI